MTAGADICVKISGPVGPYGDTAVRRLVVDRALFIRMREGSLLINIIYFFACSFMLTLYWRNEFIKKQHKNFLFMHFLWLL